MSIFLTGATGYIGSAVLRQLLLQGRDVTALVRTQANADRIQELGARAVIGDITDTHTVSALALASSGVIHTASPGDTTSHETDEAFVTAVFAGLEGSGKPYVHTGGIWSYGSSAKITEHSPLNPPELTAWRTPLEERIHRAHGVKTTVVAPGVAFGHGAGIPSMFTSGPYGTGSTPAVQLVGDGSQHWTTVYVDDLGELYVLAFDLADGGTTYIGASGENPTVREIGIAAAFGLGFDGAVRENSIEETYARLGKPFADALLLDQQAIGSAARIDLGWEPNGPTLLDDLRTGSYLK
jgi:nucleoside-diphosphate-sugar epimerase